ncbi:hypothetical protein [Longimicrobium terrae]|uniref:OmpH family outer membrane protein n=1 Tax=Longimicrobium terrae TaxID=1639882 RepID=A0A841H648_9BACT|nr:hypothetical protein [Longimicrobium terrae]MBB4639308.1 hypothetical protein [Longimicrobium terrae]MBB6073621.1 hypothetical protein [Longimicrobium terrae]NNC29373.1 hypothetical protein [Longimicrobium terrae]
MGSVRAAALAVCLVALPAYAQVRPMSTAVPAPSAPGATAGAAARGWYTELQRISVRLQRVHEAALENPALRARRDALMRAIKDGMDEADPELRTIAARAERIPAEVEAARRQGDAQRLRSLDRELAQIQARFINVEQGVLRQESVARQLRAYEELLRRQMIAIEPMTESLLARGTDLRRLIEASVSPAQRE